MDLPDAPLIRDEYALTVRLMLLACDRALSCSAPAALGRRPRAGSSEIIGEYRSLWLARNRIGGLSDSVRRLEALLPNAR